MSHDCDCDSCQRTDSRWALHRKLEEARLHDCPRGKHIARLWRAVSGTDGKGWAEYHCAACDIVCTKTGREFKRPVLCGAHPRYKAKRKPLVTCQTCWDAWFKVQRAES